MRFVLWQATFGHLDAGWIQPGGDHGLLGVGVRTTFVRGALDRLGIEARLEQRHEFKYKVDQVLPAVAAL